MLLLLLATLSCLSEAEEESILAGATVIDDGMFDPVVTPKPSDLIGDDFRTLVQTSGSSTQVAIKIDLNQSAAIHSIFLINHTGYSDEQMRMSKSMVKIYDTLTGVGKKVYDNIEDGGFFELSPVTTGRYLSLEKYFLPNETPVYNLLQLKAY